MRAWKRISIKEATYPIYGESNKSGIILSLLFWFGRFVTQILPFNLTCKTSAIINWWGPEILTFSKTASMFIPLEIALLWKVLPETLLKGSVLMEAFSRRNSEENQSPPLLSYYSGVRGPWHRPTYFPWKFINLFWAALQFEKLGQKSRSYNCWLKSLKKVQE